MYYKIFVYFQENSNFQRKADVCCGLLVCTEDECYVGGRLQIGTRPKYGFCPRRRCHSGLRIVLFRYVDSRDISLIRGNR